METFTVVTFFWIPRNIYILVGNGLFILISFFILSFATFTSYQPVSCLVHSVILHLTCTWLLFEYVGFWNVIYFNLHIKRTIKQNMSSIKSKIYKLPWKYFVFLFKYVGTSPNHWIIFCDKFFVEKSME